MDGGIGGRVGGRVWGRRGLESERAGKNTNNIENLAVDMIFSFVEYGYMRMIRI
jgi:hypothetical protein